MQHHILFVIGDTTDITTISADIQRCGVNVKTTRFELCQQELVEQATPAAVVLDLCEAHSDMCYTLCRELTTNPDTSHIPVILLTDGYAEWTPATAARIGAYDVISKDAFLVRNLIAVFNRLHII